VRWGRDLSLRALGGRIMDVPWLYEGALCNRHDRDGFRAGAGLADRRLQWLALSSSGEAMSW
jgi:hypothetical protein